MVRKSTQINSTILDKIDRYQKALKRARLPIKQLVVFGSQVKGTARWDSDIDLAVISTRFGKDSHKERVWLMRLRQPDELFEIEPHPFHPDDLNDRWDALAQEVKKYGIPVE